MNKLLWGLVLCFFTITTTSASVNSQSTHDPQLLKEIISKVWDVANAKIKDLQEFYCPDDLDYDGLKYQYGPSTPEEIVFKFAKVNNWLYCNDGAPKYCLISVRLEGNKWNTENPVINCLY